MSFSLIIAFNLIVYSKDVRELSSTMMNFRLAVIEVSVLVVFVIGWLINYTMKFMLSKRSKEFGTYMILGIERKDIIKMFLIENIFLGIFAFVVSIFIGRFFNRLVAAAGRYGKDPEIPAGPRQDPRNGVVMAGVAVENDGDLFVFGHKALLI